MTIHNHNDLYYTETELNTSGAGGQVHWDNVTNKPTIGGVGGSGQTNYISKWLDATSITISQIYDNGINVGIGTTSPGKLFHVNGEALVSDKLHLHPIGGGEYIFNPDGLTLRFYTANLERMTITNNGNIGIGTTAPLAKLHILGRGGVFGSSPFAGTAEAGVRGGCTAASSSSIGVYGYCSESEAYNYIGVYGLGDAADNYGYGGYFIGGYSGVYGQANQGNAGVYGASNGSSYGVYSAGNTGASGTKSAVVRTSRGPTELYAMESPEVWFEDFGTGRLLNGKVYISLDTIFLETVTIDSNHPMKVFIQLNGECNGVYVKKGLTGFEVIELNNGTSNVEFDYRIVAKRKGYEQPRMKIVESCYTDRNLYPDDNDPAIPSLYREKRKIEKERENSRPSHPENRE